MRFYNTATKKQEELTPLKQNQIGLYVCGPTVYASPHIGNARSVVIYDLLYRVLKTKFEVKYVRNITDVDDKINAAAKENGEPISALTERVTKDFHEVIAKLGCLPPDVEPRATAHIAEMVTLIEKLIKNGNAYEAEKHVLFDVTSDKNYGHLSNRPLDEMIAGSRVEVAPYKRNPGDFVLWKPALAGDDASSIFQSPWGPGRPGWHTECVAMSTKYLGETFDIHGGGADLTFPHHENELAQGCCANHGSSYAKMWVHNGFLTVDGEKMSKSVGNFITVRELLDKGVNGEVIRWALLSTHYSSPLDWTEKLLSDSKKTMDSFYRIYGNFPDLDKLLSKQFNGGDGDFINTDGESKFHFFDYLEDDLNVAKVSAEFHLYAGYYNNVNNPDTVRQMAAQHLIKNLKFMGFLQQTPDQYFGRADESVDVEKLINLRKSAKAAKNFAEADKIRAQLTEMGIAIEDRPGGVVEWRRL